MTTEARGQIWHAPRRPDWVTRMNDGMRGLDLRATVPLDDGSLIDAACRATNLSEFGEGAWRERLKILTRALDEEADLNFIGRILTRNDLIQYLSARLLVEDAYRRNPEIEEERIEAPILIIGQGRSGTSFLLNLLSEDPGNRSVRSWEAMFPVAPPGREHLPERTWIERADAVYSLANSITPELVAVHEFTALAPTESIHLASMEFVGDWIPGNLGQVPSFQRAAAPHIAEGIRYEKRVLKLLQWRKPARRWVLKNPAGVGYVPTTLEIYPDLKLAWAHRDPIKAMSSLVGLQGTLNWVRSDAPFKEGAHAVYFDAALMAPAMAVPMTMIESGAISKGNYANVHYRDLMRDSVAAVERMYTDLDIAFTASARAHLEDYVRKFPRSSRPPHLYPQGTSEEIARGRKAFRRYQEYFEVPDEGM